MLGRETRADNSNTARMVFVWSAVATEESTWSWNNNTTGRWTVMMTMMMMMKPDQLWAPHKHLAEWLSNRQLQVTWQLCSENQWVPTWGGSVSVQEVVVFCGVEVHDDAGSIQQLLVAAGAGYAVVAVPAVASVVQLLRLHLATRQCPGLWGRRGNKSTWSQVFQ